MKKKLLMLVLISIVTTLISFAQISSVNGDFDRYIFEKIA